MTRVFTRRERGLATASRIVLGVLFVAAGLLKAVDLGGFYDQLRAFPLGFSGYGYYAAAIMIVAAEVVLGVALLVRAFLRIVYPLTFLILLFFAGMTTWGWLAGFIKECGCFGSLLQRSSAAAVAEDIVMMILAVLAWGFSPLGEPTSKSKIAVLGLAAAVGIGLPYIFPGHLPQVYAEKGVGSYIGRAIVQGLDVPLSDGEYLIALIEIDGGKSVALLPRLNSLAANAALPRVIAICPNTVEDLDALRAVAPVEFPVGYMYRLRFKALDIDAPSLVWVRAGVIEHIWPLEPPPSDVEILKVCRNGGAGAL